MISTLAALASRKPSRTNDSESASPFSRIRKCNSPHQRQTSSGGNAPSTPNHHHLHDECHVSHAEEWLWVPDGVLGEVPAKVLRHDGEGSDGDGVVVSSIVDGNEIKAKRSACAPVHPNSMKGVADLLELGDFTMGALLHTVRQRFMQGKIYSSIGTPILISVNPYRPRPNLYSDKVATMYMTASPSSTSCPADDSIDPVVVDNMSPPVIPRGQVSPRGEHYKTNVSTQSTTSGGSTAGDSATLCSALVESALHAEAMHQLHASGSRKSLPDIRSPFANQRLVTRADDNVNISSPTEPHLFRTAQAAYTAMVTDGKAQSIIVSGESGSGKTEATKIILRYLSSCCGVGAKKNTSQSDESSWSSSGNTPSSLNVGGMQQAVESHVLESTPVLEAFGNAKTLRNDNSSRFGKFIRIYFEPSNPRKIHSAEITHYLLEKCRLVRVPDGERNFHVFYNLVRGCQNHLDESVKRRLQLSDKSVYEMLGNIDAFQEFPASRDRKDFVEVVQCLESIGFTNDTINCVWMLLAGLLHFSNSKCADYTPDERANVQSCLPMTCIVDMHEPGSFTKALDLWGLSSVDGDSRLNTSSVGTLNCSLDSNYNISMKDLLSFKQIRDVQNSRIIYSPRTTTEATILKGAISKEIYCRLFSWLVEHINTTLANASLVPGNPSRAIGLLDIYGFEVFDGRNSFEQFCINYANEKLQKHFNEHIFELEQNLYSTENIDWTAIAFQDNQQIIDALEGRRGVFNLLDDTSNLSTGSDSAFLSHVDKHVDRTVVYLPKPNLKRQSCFCVQHYAGLVFYEVEEFVSKNKDKLSAEAALYISRHTTNPILKALFDEADNAAGGSSPVGFRKSPSVTTVSYEFRQQLNHLTALLTQTTPTYIRCIKPNNEKSPDVFDTPSVIQQLKYAGLLESIRIRKAGFCIRFTFAEFLGKYSIIDQQVREIYRYICASSYALKQQSSRTTSSSTSSRTKHHAHSSRAANNTSFIPKLRTPTSTVKSPDQLCRDLLVGSCARYSTNVHDKSAFDIGVGWQIGNTKVFLKEYVLTQLEISRSKILWGFVVLIQSAYRRLKAIRLLICAVNRVVLLQRVIKCYRTFQETQSLRTVVILQSNLRMILARLHYMNSIGAVCLVQGCLRIFMATLPKSSLSRFSSTLEQTSHHRKEEDSYESCLTPNESLCTARTAREANSSSANRGHASISGVLPELIVGSIRHSRPSHRGPNDVSRSSLNSEEIIPMVSNHHNVSLSSRMNGQSSYQNDASLYQIQTCSDHVALLNRIEDLRKKRLHKKDDLTKREGKLHHWNERLREQRLNLTHLTEQINQIRPIVEKKQNILSEGPGVLDQKCQLQRDINKLQKACSEFKSLFKFATVSENQGLCDKLILLITSNFGDGDSDTRSIGQWNSSEDTLNGGASTNPFKRSAHDSHSLYMHERMTGVSASSYYPYSVPHMEYGLYEHGGEHHVHRHNPGGPPPPSLVVSNSAGGGSKCGVSQYHPACLFEIRNTPPPSGRWTDTRALSHIDSVSEPLYSNNYYDAMMGYPVPLESLACSIDSGASGNHMVCSRYPVRMSSPHHPPSTYLGTIGSAQSQPCRDPSRYPDSVHHGPVGPWLRTTCVKPSKGSRKCAVNSTMELSRPCTRCMNCSSPPNTSRHKGNNNSTKESKRNSRV